MPVVYVAGAAVGAFGFGALVHTGRKILAATEADEKLDQTLERNFGKNWISAKKFLDKKIAKYMPELKIGLHERQREDNIQKPDLRPKAPAFNEKAQPVARNENVLRHPTQQRKPRI